ncbi:MAG: VCBS repeat-containing protein [Chitinophagaceae bacterium]|nr:VCBS repeat-containing protein [Chitinophagaceae bacterium]
MTVALNRGLFIFLTAVWLVVTGCGGRGGASALFETLSPEQTNVHFSNQLVESDSLNILDYLYYYNGGGVAAGDINHDGLPDLYFSANSRGGNRLYLNKGHMQFEDITARAGVAGSADWCSGVTMADVNGDGWLDIYVCAVSRKLGLRGCNQLFINNRDGTFTDSAAAYGLDFAGYAQQAVFFDMDHDGDLDCFLLTQSSHSVATLGDTSLRRQVSPAAGSRIFRNEISQGAHRFTDVTAVSGIWSSPLGYGLGVAAADLNNDGWDDIYVGNDFHENDYYYINNHDGTFSESGAAHMNHYSRFSMGNDIADYNNDGQPDIFTVDMLPADERVLKTYSSGEQPDIYQSNIIGNGFQHQYSKNCLQVNLGNGAAFSERALQAGIAATDWSWSPLFGDFDNDGIKDLFVSNGIVRRLADLDYMKYVEHPSVAREMSQTRRLDQALISRMPEGKAVNYFFRGGEDGHFTDISNRCTTYRPGCSTGAAVADLDNDGRPDIITNNINEEATIYHNICPDRRHFLSVSCEGLGANRLGVGCKVFVFTQGHMQYQEMTLTRGFLSSSEPRMHFGLDTAGMVDSMWVVWPGQRCQVIRQVPVDMGMVVREGDANESFDAVVRLPRPSSLLQDVTSVLQLPWKHHENSFNDFSIQPLIPHALSTRGPRIAVGDVNGDGREDMYLCGAGHQPGSIWIQDGAGRFVAWPSDCFARDSAYEDTDALFFDADNDGDVDLYVCSGGNEYTGRHPLLLDRLYLNDGHGHFSRSMDGAPPVYGNKTAVCAADIDHDGDIDLFIGVGPDAAVYGPPQTSVLLINDGKGRFAAPDNVNASFRDIGMVTSALFADVDGDGWPDLVVAGEWMPVCIFHNEHGRFRRQLPEAPTGLWQCLTAADVNHDGHIDLLAGNYGLNSKLTAHEGPLKLYVKDLDRNGIVEQLLTYTDGQKEYTFLGKEALEKQVPSIKKGYLHYRDFAGKTVREVFGGQLDDALVLQADTLASGVLLNDGHGQFAFHPLPSQVQETPIFSWLVTDLDGDGRADIMAGGNLYGVLPYEGRYDAGWGDVLLNKNGGYRWLSPVNSGWLVRGEVRDIRMLKTAIGDLFVVARNNDSLRFFVRRP